MSDIEITLNLELVGKNIREIRKEKRKMTIIQLANRLGYSTGKMSNIEKGKRARLGYSELSEIANVLEEPIEKFLIEKSAFENVREKLLITQQRLNSGLLSGLKEKIIELEVSLGKETRRDILIHINYLWAQYYRELNDYDLATEYYKEVLNSDVQDIESLQIKMKSFTGLASIQMRRQQLMATIETLRLSLDFMNKNTSNLYIEDKANIHYNLALSYLKIGYSELSDFHIESCLELTKEKNERMYYHSLYLLAISYLVRREYSQANKYLFETIRWFQLQKDNSLLFNCIEFLFVLHAVRPCLVSKEILFEFRDVITSDSPVELIQQKFKCMYRMIEFDLQHDNLKQAAEMLVECKVQAEKYFYVNQHRLYMLEASLIRKTLKNKKTRIHEEMKLLIRSLGCFDATDRSAEKAAVLYQIGKLTSNNENVYYEEALSIYDEAHHSTNIESALLYILPNTNFQ